MDVIHEPLSTLWLMCDGTVAGCLHICQSSVSKISCPAADMSTPESGSTLTSLVPEGDVILLMIVGVGTVVSPMTL